MAVKLSGRVKPGDWNADSGKTGCVAESWMVDVGRSLGGAVIETELGVYSTESDGVGTTLDDGGSVGDDSLVTLEEMFGSRPCALSGS